MDKYFFLIVSSLIVANVGCDSDSPVSSYDNKLKKHIIGLWTDSQGYSVEFYENNFFRDTINMISPFNDTAIAVRYGKYSIRNSFLTQTDFTFKYVYLASFSGMAIGKNENKISINNNIMQWQGILSFSNVNKPSKEIWGTWTAKVYYCNYDTDSSNINGPSYGNESYTFTMDSAKCQKFVEIEYPINYTNTAWLEYSYNPPYLNIPAVAFYNLKVDFEYDKMIWFYDNALINLVKYR
jgi:hypothetical protein